MPPYMVYICIMCPCVICLCNPRVFFIVMLWSEGWFLERKGLAIMQSQYVFRNIFMLLFELLVFPVCEHFRANTISQNAKRFVRRRVSATIIRKMYILYIYSTQYSLYPQNLLRGSVAETREWFHFYSVVGTFEFTLDIYPTPPPSPPARRGPRPRRLSSLAFTQRVKWNTHIAHSNHRAAPRDRTKIH